MGSRRPVTELIIWKMLAGRAICTSCGHVWPITYHAQMGEQDKHCDECDTRSGVVYEHLPERLMLAILVCRCCGTHYGGTFHISSVPQLSCSECSAYQMEVRHRFKLDDS